MKQTLAEKQAWMRRRYQRPEREPAPKVERLSPVQVHRRKRIAGELNELMLSGDDLDIQFLLAIIELRNTAKECRVDEPYLTLTGRGPGVRHVRFCRKVEDVIFERVDAVWFSRG
jgi:hypothetical protein